MSAQQYNVGKPPAKRRRVPYIKPAVVDSDATSDTASSSGHEMSTFFEHSTKIVPHAILHFPDQVIMGGTHDFHDTKENEASHKECVKTAGGRARIYNDVNLSAYNMLQFNMQREWFDSIFDIRLGRPVSQPDNLEAESLKQIRLSNRIDDDTIAMRFLTRAGPHNRRVKVCNFDYMLCEGVPLSLRELLCLFAGHVRFPVEDAHLLLQCSWTLGYHVKSLTSKGVTRNYWGGGVTPKTSSNYLRGDWLETNVNDIDNNGVLTSRLARVICGVSVANLHKCDGLLPSDHQYETEENKAMHRVHFLLVRYAQQHRLSRRSRGPNHRPICPGLLHDTHCLWEWARRDPTYRRGCLLGRAWDANKHFLGSNEESQLLRKDNEMRAWYDLIQVSDISQYANIQSDADRDGALLQSVMWC